MTQPNFTITPPPPLPMRVSCERNYSILFFYFNFIPEKPCEQQIKPYLPHSRTRSIFLIAHNFFPPLRIFARNIKFDVKFNNIYCAYVFQAYLHTHTHNSLTTELTNTQWNEKRWKYAWRLHATYSQFQLWWSNTLFFPLHLDAFFRCYLFFFFFNVLLHHPHNFIQKEKRGKFF